MSLMYFTTLFVIVVNCQMPPTPGPKVANPDYQWAPDDAVEAWKDLKFGLRIHWGLYSTIPCGPESWCLKKSQNLTFMKEYWGEASNWRPAHYNADDWVALMNRSGVKHFVFTTKHHEGFSMYDTHTTVHECWDITNDTKPGIKNCSTHFSIMESFGRDVTAELVEAARRGGVVPGLYFSHPDWYDAAFRMSTPSALRPFIHNLAYNRTQDPLSWERVVLRHRAQIAEILTRWGDIAELSLDIHLNITDDEMSDTMMLARQLAPKTLFRNRGIGVYGDYYTPEEHFPNGPQPGLWQVIYHGSKWMSYDPVAADYVNGSFIVWHLVDVVAKGGNMQIGYGPDRDGQFHPLAVKALEYTGQWLSLNGEAIYSTRMWHSWNDTLSTQVRYTRTKDNSTVYATSLGWPVGGQLNLTDAAPRTGTTVNLLGYGAVKWSKDGGVITLNVPDAPPQGTVSPGYVFKLPQ